MAVCTTCGTQFSEYPKGQAPDVNDACGCPGCWALSRDEERRYIIAGMRLIAHAIGDRDQGRMHALIDAAHILELGDRLPPGTSAMPTRRAAPLSFDDIVAGAKDGVWPNP